MNIVITGSTRGIGFGLALEFLKRKHNVIINGTSATSINNALLGLIAYQGNVHGFTGMVQEENFGEKLFTYACEKFKTVDIWINNAGINQPLKKIWEVNASSVHNLVSVNIEAVVNITAFVFNAMHKQGYGKVFNMEGLGSDGRMIDKTALYGTSKRAISYYTKAFSKECANSPIQVGITSPGMVITDFITEPIEQQTAEEAKKTKKVFNMLGSRVEDIAPFLVKGMLRTKKHYPRIEYLTKARIVSKLMRYLINPQDYFIE